MPVLLMIKLLYNSLSFAFQDSKLVIDRYKSGFTKPPDIPFEDLSNGKTNSQNNLNINPDRGTMKGGTIGKRKDRAGLFNIFSKNKVGCFQFSSVIKVCIW